MTSSNDGGNRPEAPAPIHRDERTVVRLPRNRDGQSAEPGLHETVQGSRPGSRFLRLTRRREQKLRRVSEGEFEATEVALRPATPLGRLWADVRHFFLGRALATRELSQQRLSKVKALAIFSSDNLSSSAYASEEILLVLVLAGTSALGYSIPIALAIAALAAIVATSYVQLVKAYPHGGGAYEVTRENIGPRASLLTGSTLIVDYILTVAVSTAAGVAAITSALPELLEWRVELAIGFVILLSLGNLRGIRESGTLFALPPYFFILTFGGMLLIGLARVALGDTPAVAAVDHPVEQGTQALTIFLLLRAFASGAAALTGIEAIADGTPSFKPPEARNASITLIWMATILASLFVGTTLLANEIDIVPSETRTVVAQIALAVYGDGVFFYMVQIATAMILILAANTAFAGLPTLASVMARNGDMPKQFGFRGDRLAFSNGIIVLGIASCAVLFFFDADTHKIIPLYAFGVFMAFTLSQAGMVQHWRRTRDAGWRRSLVLNALGAVATGIVAVIVGGTKFMDGAWLSMLAMVVLVGVMWMIRQHYRDANNQLGRGLTGAEPVADFFYGVSAGRPQTVIVPVDEINRAVLRTVAYARTQPNHMVTVVLPEFVPKRFWQRFLHNQLPIRLKKALMDRRNTVVVDVPYHFQ